MRIKALRSPWTLLIWPASLLLLLLLIWTTGYVYWQIRISRAIADVKRAPGKYFESPLYKNQDLLDIGSRGFHRVMAELDDALLRGDEDQAAVLYCGIADLVEGAWGGYGKAAEESRLPLRDKPTRAEMHDDCREFWRTWSQYEDAYEPWWKWWSGKRRSR